MENLSLLESAYPTLAKSKPEMQGLLSAWLELGVQQKASQTYLGDLISAQETLEKSASVPEMLAKLRHQNSNKGSSS